MGVLGFVPFIQKAFPEVVKTLPNRLSELSGKVVAIDGTLITQRLHFAPMPHPYRHVLGWYRLAKELQESNVRAICVFDGKQRSRAKQGEIARRRAARNVTSTRAVFELLRLQRLRRLTEKLRALPSLDVSELQSEFAELRKTTETLKPPVISQHFLTPGSSFLELVSEEANENLPVSDAPESSSDPTSHTDPIGSPDFIPPPEATHTSDAPLILDDAKSICVEASEGHGLAPSPSEAESESPLDEPSTPSSHDLPSEPTGENVEKISVQKTISSLYEEYCYSIPQLAILTDTPTMVEPPNDSPSDITSKDETEVDHAMSKNQQDLAIEEGKFWDDLVQSVLHGDVHETLAATAAELELKSDLMSESYRRRTRPPTQDTYDECKEILEAMGVPCVEPAGAFEAEALAASMVIHGHADYVVSEDTDVLVYEAPLLRNITSRNGPLVVISGSEVRTTLQLERASYIDFALLLGTDFSQRIKNVGPARALKFIRQHGSIERVLEQERRYSPRIPQDAYLDEVNRARVVFETLPPVPIEDIERGEPDEGQVWEILDRYKLHRLAAEGWDCDNALAGNHFNDDPSGE